MIDLKPVEITDKKWMDPLIFAGNMRGCEHGFTNIFIWSQTYHYHVAQVAGYLVAKTEHKDHGAFLYPAGSGDIKPALEAMLQHMEALGKHFSMIGLTPENIAELDTLFPGKFKYTAKRDIFDYLYLGENLATLKGKKLHGKRNHINRFIENNPSWRFEPITPDNIAECWLMNKEWCRINGCEGNGSLQEESCAIRLSFDNFDALGLEGGLLRVDGKVVAFTMGDLLTNDTFDVHIEKAFGEVQGAYPMINREYVRHIMSLYPNVIYFNREEDVGSEGLRKAKLSYYPEMMVEKHVCELA